MESKLFRKYTGTKTVEALPATAIEAKQKFNANIPNRVVDANPGKEGYVIDYPDGYRSWCPKKEFEDSYKISETFIDRLKIEHDDLIEKLFKGMNFLFKPNNGLSEDQRRLLDWQLTFMQKYAEALTRRMELCEKETPKIADGCNTESPSCTVDPKESYGKE